MSNSYFRFKNFTIHQEHCAMKVSTDACIHGAWTPVPAHARRVLDIGMGTGLLSLMLAQRYANVLIDGIELDEPAAQQAMENVAQSPWAERIKVIADDATTYKFNHAYDVIISNPPFFNDSLLGDTLQRNQARHTITLTYNSLFTIIRNNLNNGGVASVLLPATNTALWESILQQHGWHATSLLFIHPRAGKEANRVVVCCSPVHSTQQLTEHLYIRDSEDGYSADFRQLLGEFYLHL